MDLNVRTIIGILLVFLCIGFHELGHGIGMYMARVPIKEVAFGFGPQVWSTTGSLNNSSVVFSIRTIPLGAFVSSDLTLKQLESVPVFQQYLINGLGVWFNILIGYVIALAIILSSKKPYARSILKTKPMLGLAAIICLGILDFLLQNGFFWKYGMLFLSALMTFLIIKEILTGSKQFFGPIKTYQMIRDADSFRVILTTVAGISVGCALVNILPFVPADGGRNIEILLQGHEQWQLWYTKSSMVLLLGTILFFFGKWTFELWDETFEKKRGSRKGLGS